MKRRFILRESHQGRITPRPDLGLYQSARLAKVAAKRIGLPVDLIYEIRRVA